MKGSYCDICCKNMDNKNKNKHLKSKSHLYFSSVITVKHTIEKTDLFQVEDIIKNFIIECEKKFVIFGISCEMIRPGLTNSIMRTNNLTILINHYNTINEILKHNEKEILRLDIFFTVDRKYSTYKHYLQQNKSLLEWTLFKKILKFRNLKDNNLELSPIYAYDNLSFLSVK